MVIYNKLCSKCSSRRLNQTIEELLTECTCEQNEQRCSAPDKCVCLEKNGYRPTNSNHLQTYSFCSYCVKKQSRYSLSRGLFVG